MSWTIHKFGGTSLADADCFRRVAEIIERQPPGNCGVVVSAVGGVTDVLFGLIGLYFIPVQLTPVYATVREL